jgi:hypothetical protein
MRRDVPFARRSKNLRLARTDPAGFATGFDEPLLIDEVQRGRSPCFAGRSKSIGLPERAASCLPGPHDFVLESADGRVVGIEAKAAVDVDSSARDTSGDRLWTIPPSTRWES